MKILLLTQFFHPESAYKGLPFAKELVAQGHQVQVLTGFPNYPHGKLYPGYKIKLFQLEIIEGISVIRTALYPSHDSSAFQRFLNYASFGLSAALLGPFLIKQADIVHVYHAPATTALPAMIFKIFRKIPFVYDINDLWPDSLAASKMLQNRFALKCVDLWCNLTYRMAAHITVVAPGTKSRLVSRGVDDSKISVIYNWCDEIQKSPKRIDVSAIEVNFHKRFNIVFAGTMGKVQGLDSVLDTAKILDQQHPAIQFVFIGGGVEVKRLKSRVAAESIGNCLFLAQRPVSEIGAILKLADVLLIHLKDDPLFEITIPGKTSAYMAIGKPILMAVRGDAADLVKVAKAGICCTPESPKEIAETALELFAMSEFEKKKMGANGQEFYERELSIKVGAERFERLFLASISL